MRFIKHGSTLINASAIATAEVGEVNTRGFRPVVLRDSAGRELGVIPYNKLDHLPGFVRVGDLIINPAQITTAEQAAQGLKLCGVGGLVLATVDEEAFLAAIGGAA